MKNSGPSAFLVAALLASSCTKEQKTSADQESGARKSSIRSSSTTKQVSKEQAVAKKIRGAFDPTLDERLRSLNLDKLVREFTADEFDAIWQQLMDEATPSGTKRDVIPLVLQRYTELGHFPEAFALAKSLESGSVRSSSFGGIFSRASIPLGEQLKLRRGLETPEDRSMAASGIGPAHHASFKDDTFDSVGKAFASFEKLDEEEQKILDFRLGSLLTNARSQGPKSSLSAVKESVRLLQSLAGSGKIPSSVVGETLVNITSGDPLALWEGSKDLFRSVFPEENGIPDSLASDMAFRDAKRTLDLIVQNNGSNGIEQSLESLLSSDNAAATVWLEANQAKLTAGQKQEVTKAIAEYSLKKGDLSASKQAAYQISNETVRAEVLNRIEKREISEVSSAVKADPVGTLESLTQSSRVGDNSALIEAAVSTWLGTDSDGAGEWYMANAEKFSPPQQSAVYSAFARQSISAGDLTRAEQWASSIPDGDAQMIIRGEIAVARRSAK